MYALLRALNIGADDEVIIQAYTCLAVPLPILAVGAKPVYVDIDPHTYSADPERVRSMITTRTRAIVVQHTFGIPAHLDELISIANENAIPLLEDCCHSNGSSYHGRPLGSFGAAAFRSFQWSKPTVIGRGGIAMVNDPSLAPSMRRFHSACANPPMLETAMVNLEYAGYQLLKGKPILDRVRQAVRVLVPSATGTFKRDELKFKATRDYFTRMPRSLERRLLFKQRIQKASIDRRRALTRRYHEHFTRLGISNISLDDTDAVLMSYPVAVDDRAGVLRQARRAGIGVDIAFSSPIDPLLTPDQWSRVGYQSGLCPRAECLSSNTIAFPIREWIKPGEVERVLAFAGGLSTLRYHEAKLETLLG